jgi:UDP-N-acetylmuramate dehydrogenase
MEILSDFPLFKFNTFGIEACAKEYVEVKDEGELFQLVKDRKLGSKQLLFLGGGSNILFTGDYNGTVIKISTSGKEIISEDEETIVLKVAAGEDWDSLVEYCVNQGWAGLENLSGIPGQVGSSPIQNIGAYGTELKDHFESLEGVNLCTGESFVYDTERCQFGYRDSIFKRALKGRVVISSVVFRLNKKPDYNLSYQALKQKLESVSGERITLQKVRDAVLEIRSSKLPDPKIIGNAGSFFKNPVVNAKQLEELKDRFPGIVSYPVSLTPFTLQPPIPPLLEERGTRGEVVADCKLAAGWLLSNAAGRDIGRAMPACIKTRRLSW